jgi:hypothetical protein
MHQGRGDYPKVQSHQKNLSTTELVCGPWKLSGTPKRDQSLFSLLLEIEGRLRKRAETIRLSNLDDPKKKIASLRVSTISPVIASSRYPLFPSRRRAEVAVSD